MRGKRIGSWFCQGWRYLRTAAAIPPLDEAALREVRERAISYVAGLRLRDGPYGRFRYCSRSAEPILYASVFAALFVSLVRMKDELSTTERDEWLGYIASHQCADDLFRNPLVDNDIAETADWWGWRHLTLLSLMALHALDGPPAKPLRFLECVDTPAKARGWLSEQNWTSRSDFTSNAVQNYVATMQYARDALAETSLQDAIDAMLDGVAERCDTRTGLWGSGFGSSRADLSRGVQTGCHLWLLFWYEGRDIPHFREAFASIRRLQGRLGGFPPAALALSSACQDIDALDPIVRIALRHPELPPPARHAVRRGLRWVLANFGSDGGAVFQKNHEFVYGHERMRTGVNESSIFATWFRMLSVAVCLELLEEPTVPLQFRFLRCPGHQFSPSCGLWRKEGGE